MCGPDWKGIGEIDLSPYPAGNEFNLVEGVQQPEPETVEAKLKKGATPQNLPALNANNGKPVVVESEIGPGGVKTTTEDGITKATHPGKQKMADADEGKKVLDTVLRMSEPYKKQLGSRTVLGG